MKIPKIDPQVSPNHFTIKNNLGVQVTIARSDQSDHLSVSDILNNTTTTTNLKVYCNCICLQSLTCHDPVCIQTNLVHYVLLLARTYSLTRSGAAQTLCCTGGCISCGHKVLVLWYVKANLEICPTLAIIILHTILNNS